MKSFDENPMPKLEFTKHGFDFELLRQKYDCGSEVFPKNINFKEPPGPIIDLKDYIFNIFPESKKQSLQRGLSLVELLNKRIQAESENGRYKVCYLIISHGTFIDELS